MRAKQFQRMRSLFFSDVFICIARRCRILRSPIFSCGGFFIYLFQELYPLSVTGSFSYPDGAKRATADY